MAFLAHLWYSVPTLTDIINRLYLKFGHLVVINRFIKGLAVVYLTAMMLLPHYYGFWGAFFSNTLLILLMIWITRHDGINVDKRLSATVRKQMAGFDKFTLDYHNNVQYVIIMTIGLSVIIRL